MEQYHYEFNQWEQAFKDFYDKRCGYDLKDDDGKVLGFRSGNPNLVFLISTDAYTGGYWIEENAEEDPDTYVYKTVKEVKALEKRVRKARSKTVNLSLGQIII